jgi:hypothetical protein
MASARMMIRGMGILMLVAVSAHGEGPAGARSDEAPAARSASVTLTFTERSEQSTNAFIASRMGWPLAAEAAAMVDYNLPDESFEVYVPADYTGDKPFGLLVFVNPHPSGRPPQNYVPLLDKYHLIYVGPNKVGNDRFVRLRMGLAIDAVENMRKRYKIDPERIYVSGISGGGRVASMLGVGFADVFRGGFYIIGCDFYKEEKSTEKNGYYRRSYNVPPAKIFNLARKSSKHVFLTGDNDGNRDQTQLYYNGFKRDGFEHITYFQVPGMGHQAPDAEWFEKGLAALDEPIAAAPVAGGARRPVTPATRPSAPPATTQAMDRATVAARLLGTAKMYVDNRQYELGRQKLTWIVQNFADTPAGITARKMLDQIKDRPE